MRYTVLLLLLFTLITVDAQQPAYLRARDSLRKRIASLPADSFQAKAIIDLGRTYFAHSPDSAIPYFKQAEAISRKVGYSTGVVTAMGHLGEIESNKNNLKEAMRLDSGALAYANKSGDTKAQGVAYLNYAGLFSKTGEFKKAVELTLKAVDYVVQRHDSIYLATIYTNLGYYNYGLNNMGDAYKYDRLGAFVSIRTHQDRNLMISLLNLSQPLTKLKKYDSADVVLRQADSLAKQLNDKYFGDIILHNLIVIRQQNGHVKETRPLIQQLLREAVASDNKEALVLDILAMGDYHILQYHFDSARYYYRQALDTSLRHKIVKWLENTYKALADCEAGLHNFKKYDYYSGLRDSVAQMLHSDELQKNTEALEAGFKVKEKEAEIVRLSQEREIQQLRLARTRTAVILLALLAVALVVAAWLIVRNLRQKRVLQQQRIAELEKEKQLLAAEAVVLGQEEERTRLAKDLHDGLGGILSGVKYSFNDMRNNFIITPESADAFDRTMALLDKSITELRAVSHNMMPEALLRFGLDTALRDYCNTVRQHAGVDLNYQSFDLQDTDIEKSKASVIYRVIQELLNNMLKHAQARSGLVQLVRKGNALSITVEDDGRGFDAGKAAQGDGIGMKNIFNRVQYLNGTIEIETGEGKGVSVIIEIPNIAA